MKNLKGSVTWKDVDTILFGDELLVQFHEGQVSAPPARPEKKWCPSSFKMQNLPRTWWRVSRSHKPKGQSRE